MTTDRPATQLWAAADRERQPVRSEQEAEWRRRMLSAGHLDPAQLSDQARRILAWLAEWEDWTVDGVAELLAAAHLSGRHPARPAPERDESIPVNAEGGPLDAPPAGAITGAAAADNRAVPTPAGHEPINARLAVPQQPWRPENPAVER